MATARFVAELAREIFGDVLDSVWMYGSRARGDHGKESDLDLLVVITEPVSIRDERSKRLRRRIFMEYEAAAESWLTETHVCHTEQFERWDTMFYRNVRSDAVRVA